MSNVTFDTHISILENGKIKIQSTRTIDGKPKLWTKIANSIEECRETVELFNQGPMLLSDNDQQFYDAGFRTEATGLFDTVKSILPTITLNVAFTISSTLLLMNEGTGIWPASLEALLARGINALWSAIGPISGEYIERNKFNWEKSIYDKAKVVHNIADQGATVATLAETHAFNPLTDEQKQQPIMKQLEDIFLNKNSAGFLLEQVLRTLKNGAGLLSYFTGSEAINKVANGLADTHAKMGPLVVTHAFARVGYGVYNQTSVPNDAPIINTVGIAMATVPCLVAIGQRIKNALTAVKEPIVTATNVYNSLKSWVFGYNNNTNTSVQQPSESALGFANQNYGTEEAITIETDILPIDQPSTSRSGSIININNSKHVSVNVIQNIKVAEESLLQISVEEPFFDAEQAPLDELPNYSKDAVVNMAGTLQAV